MVEGHRPEPGREVSRTRATPPPAGDPATARQAAEVYRHAVPATLVQAIPAFGRRRVLAAIAAELAVRTPAELAERIRRRWEPWQWREDIADATAVAIMIVRRGYNCPTFAARNITASTPGKHAQPVLRSPPRSSTSAPVRRASRPLPCRPGQSVGTRAGPRGARHAAVPAHTTANSDQDKTGQPAVRERRLPRRPRGSGHAPSTRHQVTCVSSSSRAGAATIAPKPRNGRSHPRCQGISASASGTPL